MLKTPVFCNPFVAMAARLSMSFEHWVFFNSHSVARASAMAPFVMAFAPAFIVFIGAIALAEKTLDALAPGHKNKTGCPQPKRLKPIA